MFSRILIPLDGSQLSESALPHAVAVARLFKSQMILLHVLESSSGMDRKNPVDPLEWQIYKSESELYLQSQADQLRQEGLEVEHILLEGKTAETIVQYAQSEEIDLIVMSSHGQGGLSRWDISSVVQKVLAKVYRSVMIVRAYQFAGEQVEFKRILVPLDCSKRSECSLPIAIALAEASQARLILATILRKPEYLSTGIASMELAQLADEFVAIMRKTAEPYLEEQKNRLTVPAETIVTEGMNVAHTLHELAEQEDIDLVLLCAHGQSGFFDYPYGSVANTYIQHGTRSVLVIQDVPPTLVRPTAAEVNAEKYGRR